jgi:hypothetical protein
MQLATVGYSAAYVHLREAGITYNPLSVTNDAWTTNPGRPTRSLFTRLLIGDVQGTLLCWSHLKCLALVALPVSLVGGLDALRITSLTNLFRHQPEQFDVRP